MTDRIWILGASDPEMEAIESLLRECGEHVAYAVDARGERVRGGEAYRAHVALSEVPSAIYLVECHVDVDAAIDDIGGTDRVIDVRRIDHHRPGDPGYGRPPQEFMAASSIGQVIAELAIMRTWREETPEGKVYFPWEIPIKLAGWRTLPGGSHHDHDSTWGIDEIGEYTEDAYGESGEAFVKEMVEEGGYYHVPSIGWVFVASRGGHELGGSVDAIVIPDRFVLAAAADHCLAAAYRGECPGVDPDALMRWRVETRAAFQGRSVEELLADVERAREALRAAPLVELSEPRACEYHGATHEPGCGACAHAVVHDLRGRDVPELPEAAAREGVAYLATVADRDGRRKVVLGGHTTPETVRAFMAEWAPAQGVVDIYGDPARGFAGGYLPQLAVS